MGGVDIGPGRNIIDGGDKILLFERAECDGVTTAFTTAAHIVSQDAVPVLVEKGGPGLHLDVVVAVTVGKDDGFGAAAGEKPSRQANTVFRWEMDGLRMETGEVGEFPAVVRFLRMNGPFRTDPTDRTEDGDSTDKQSQGEPK